jgi:hypothetical protein
MTALALAARSPPFRQRRWNRVRLLIHADFGLSNRDETSFMWRYRIGRLLQLFGLLVLPFAIASELMDKVGLSQSLLIAAAGAAVFYVGVQVQHRS